MCSVTSAYQVLHLLWSAIILTCLLLTCILSEPSLSFLMCATPYVPHSVGWLLNIGLRFNSELLISHSPTLFFQILEIALLYWRRHPFQQPYSTFKPKQLALWGPVLPHIPLIQQIPKCCYTLTSIPTPSYPCLVLASSPFLDLRPIHRPTKDHPAPTSNPNRTLESWQVLCPFASALAYSKDIEPPRATKLYPTVGWSRSLEIF